MTACDFQGRVAKGTAAATLLFQRVSFGGSQRPCHEDTPAALRRGPCGEELRLLGTVPCEQGTPEPGPLAPDLRTTTALAAILAP